MMDDVEPEQRGAIFWNHFTCYLEDYICFAFGKLSQSILKCSASTIYMWGGYFFLCCALTVSIWSNATREKGINNVNKQPIRNWSPFWCSQQPIRNWSPRSWHLTLVTHGHKRRYLRASHAIKSFLILLTVIFGQLLTLKDFLTST